ncbi:methyl-accepting chemotaxis protein [Gloeothece verrucosa]|uniref:Methyl-accepting chemotaxis sensory transducer n=1 Tax=Gloeothece verrucosa (strain PCC 7822) TaxID=497965 RepID=E0UB20_GLOV7|nr:methyl-accepting chemotaxis protein [Gloeothece verrucosa]ADN16265.1 methyl-accepting chemotaxis sensory transducer [Gloeothece verrucosa PCC 7822]
MSIFDMNKLQNRIFAGYGIPLVILLVLGGTTLGAMNYRNQLNKEVENSNASIQALDQLVIGTGKMVRAIRGQVLFPQDVYYRENFQKGLEIYQAAAKQSDKLLTNTDYQGDWQAILDGAENIEKQGQEVLDNIQAGKVPQAKAMVAELKVSSFDEAYQDLVEKQKKLIETDTNREEFASAITSWVTIGGTVLAIGVSGAAGWIISSGISQQLRKSAHEISSSSAEIATTMEQQERTANQQAASVNETTTTMDELGASSRTSEEQAEAASKSAQEVLELARRGNQAVEETVASMIDLRGKVAAIADQTVRLSEQTNLIGNISELVSDLAQQTNMLALNASVEAVRAGENGQGFAIVAEEIRKLADQSKQSAGKISSLVSDIQNAINTTVMVTDEGTKTVNAGMNVTERTAQAFGGVVEAVNNVAMNSQQIALNIRQQSRAVQQVLAAMDSINQGAQQSATGITQIKTGTHQLKQTATDLQAII